MLIPPVPLWASYGDVTAVEQRTLRIEADLRCELVTVSEFHRREVYLCLYACTF